MNVIDQVKYFYNSYKGEKSVIGKTVNGEDIYRITVKKTNYPVIISQYAIHAREFITAYLSLLDIEDFSRNGKVGTVHFIPLLNPDGVKICLSGKPLYKANANGVDLNVNFDALWGMGKSNVKVAGDQNYIGPYPFSENESIAIRDFTLKIKPHGTLSFHSKGEVIYYGFMNKNLSRDSIIADKLCKSSGYNKEIAIGSAGGYKDWCISEFGIPAFTIEVGEDNLSHPIGKESLTSIYDKTKDIVKIFTESL